jgi:hypothetical protein
MARDHSRLEINKLQTVLQFTKELIDGVDIDEKL